MNSSQLSAVRELRRVFSHIDTDCTISASLTPAQEKALEVYRHAFNLEPMAHEGLPDATTDEEKAMIPEFRTLLNRSGRIETEDDKDYASDLRLLQYLRARDHHMGAWGYERRWKTVLVTGTGA